MHCIYVVSLCLTQLDRVSAEYYDRMVNRHVSHYELHLSQLVASSLFCAVSHD